MFSSTRPLFGLTKPNFSHFVSWITAWLYKYIINNMSHTTTLADINSVKKTTNILRSFDCSTSFEGTPPRWHFVPTTKLFSTHNCWGHKAAWFSPTRLRDKPRQRLQTNVETNRHHLPFVGWGPGLSQKTVSLGQLNLCTGSQMLGWPSQKWNGGRFQDFKLWARRDVVHGDSHKRRGQTRRGFQIVLGPNLGQRHVSEILFFTKY